MTIILLSLVPKCSIHISSHPCSFDILLSGNQGISLIVPVSRNRLPAFSLAGWGGVARPIRSQLQKTHLHIKTQPNASAGPTPGLALAIITLLGLLLRLLTLDAHGLWIDEVTSLDVASLGFPTFITSLSGYLSNQTPLHYIITWLTSLPTDATTTTIFVRMPSTVLGALTIPVVYALGQELFGKAQGLIAALLLALSSTHLNYSQDIRPYSLLVFFTLLSVYCLVKADSTNSWGWWAGFVAASVADTLIAYVALTLAIPPLLLLLALVLWKRRPRRGEKPDPSLLRRATLATVMLIVGLALSAIPLLAGPHFSPDLGKFSLISAFLSIPELLTFFTQFGLASGIERQLQLLVLITALLGLVLSVAHPVRAMRRYEGSLFCSLYLVIPAFLLAIFATTTAVFQRYALFVMPFYFLLVGHCLAAIFTLIKDKQAIVGRITALLLGSLLIGSFIIGAYSYISPESHSKVAFRPDFRGVAAYLSQYAKAADIAVFVDDTDHGYTVSNFYWKGKPPILAYDSRDPLLFTQAVGGDIYWVVSLDNADALDRLAQADTHWTLIASFERVLLLRETGSRSMLDSTARLVDTLSTMMPDFQPILTLVGCVQQARGQFAQAANTYRRAGAFFPIGDDYLRAADDYDRLGHPMFAWREALLSKYQEPFLPEVHQWLATRLQAENLLDQSRAEAQLAQLLTTSR
jgi:4-amino-4-deoxy-L-arabinose transferase-like glycosyltransferase